MTLANHYSSLCLSFPFSLMRGLSFPEIPVYFRLSPRLNQKAEGRPKGLEVLTWCCPSVALSVVGSPSTDRPGILFASKVSIRQSPLLGAGGEGLRARPPLSKVEMSLTMMEGIRMGMGWSDGSEGLPRPARTLPLRGRGQLLSSGEAATLPVALKRRQRARISRRAAALFQNRQELGGRERRAARSADVTQGLPPPGHPTPSASRCHGNRVSRLADE